MLGCRAARIAAANKAALQSRFGLDQDPEAFVIGVVSRLTLQKGVDVLLGAMPVLIAAGAQIAVGTRREPTDAPTAAHPPGFAGPRRF